MQDNKELFAHWMTKYAESLSAIRTSAHETHDRVNQHYDGDKPYGFHLDMVADGVRDYGHLVCQQEADFLPLFFGAYFHDSIEDARMTYNDVMKEALRLGLDKEQALMGTEIVYALTNDKGRNRAERAGEHYYQGIRETPYAPFCKLCDRLANLSYSARDLNQSNDAMLRVYRGEMPHFLQSITVQSTDIRYSLPQQMLDRIQQILEG